MDKTATGGAPGGGRDTIKMKVVWSSCARPRRRPVTAALCRRATNSTRTDGDGFLQQWPTGAGWKEHTHIAHPHVFLSL